MSAPASQKSPPPVLSLGLASRGALILLLAAATGGFVVALAALLPPGIDFYHWYYNVPKAWLLGETRLYDDASARFFSPPWMVWLLAPLTVLPVQWAMAVFTVGNMAILGGVSYAYARENGAGRPWLIALAVLLCPYSLASYFLGTPDAWSLLGLFGCYVALRRQRPWLLGASLLLAAVRPQQVLLTLPPLLLGLRYWQRRALLEAAVLPVIVVLLSGIGFGWDWPLRWWQQFRADPPSSGDVASTYSVLASFGLPVTVTALVAVVLAIAVLRHLAAVEQITPRSFDLALAANAVVTPYLRSPSYIVLMALAWAGLASRRPRWAVLAYLLTLPNGMVMLFFWNDFRDLWWRLPVLEVAFPMVLLGLLVLDIRLAAQQPATVAAVNTAAEAS